VGETTLSRLFGEDTCIMFDSLHLSPVDILEERDMIQKDPDRLEQQTHAKVTKFNKAKYKVLHLGQGNSQFQYKLGDELIESSPEQKDLRILVGEKSDMNWQCALAAQKANCILACRKRSMASRLREVTFPLCSALVRPHLGSCIHLWSPQHRKDMDLGAGPEEGHKNGQRDGKPLL